MKMLVQCNNDSANRRHLEQQTQKQDVYIQRKAKRHHSASHAAKSKETNNHPADRENGNKDLPCEQSQYRWHCQLYKDQADVDRVFEASNKPFSKDEDQSALAFRSSFAGSTVLHLICSLLTRVCPRRSRSRIRTQPRVTFRRQADRHIPQEA